jgi:putative tricarboxylic transport membrane protein
MAERLVALLSVVASGAYLALSFGFALGTAARPGPGYFPVAVGAFLCAVAAVFTVLAWRRPRGAAAAPTGDSAMDAAGARGRVAAMAGGLAAFVLLLPWLGYPVVSFGLVALLLRRLGGMRWTLTLATALLSAAGSYYVFAVLLSVPLPRGLFAD